MQDVDGPAHIQTLPQPTRGRGVRVQAKSLRVVPRAEDLDGVGGHVGRRRDLGQQLAVRAAEAQLAIGLSIDQIPLGR